jgi:hypothetical protein
MLIVNIKIKNKKFHGQGSAMGHVNDNPNRQLSFVRRLPIYMGK